MDEIKLNLFMLSKEDIQEIIKPYLEIQKNGGALFIWRCRDN